MVLRTLARNYGTYYVTYVACSTLICKQPTSQFLSVERRQDSQSTKYRYVRGYYLTQSYEYVHTYLRTVA